MSVVTAYVARQFDNLCFDDLDSTLLALNELVKVYDKRGQEANQLFDKLVTNKNEISAVTIGECRSLCDLEWRQLKLPIMCKIYLKRLIRASKRTNESKMNTISFMSALEKDFNDGQPFDLTQYQVQLDQLISIGFSLEKALESLLVTECKGIPHAVEFLTCGDDKQLKLRTQSAVKQQQQALAKCVFPEMGNKESLESMKKQILLMKLQHTDNMKELEYSLRQSTIKEETMTSSLKTSIYQSYLRGIIASGIISPTAVEDWKQRKQEFKITDQLHNITLKSLGINNQQFIDMQKSSMREDMECVVCLDAPKEYMIMNCMHVCVCEGCSKNFTKGSDCPMCGNTASKIKRVYL